MEIITSSPGITVVLNQCSHVPPAPNRTIYQNIRANSAFPTLNNSFSSLRLPRSPNKALTYGSSMILPVEKSLQRSSSALGSSLGSSQRRVAVPRYDAINDPHLRDYFERKFKLSSAKKKRAKIKKVGPNECAYKVRVRTGNFVNSGTDANVYITIHGARFNLPRIHLFNKYDAIRTETGYKFKFDRNSTHNFRIVGLDLGQISHITVEHDGKELLKSWYLQDILITNTKSHKSWLFECGDWLSLEHGLGKTKVNLTPTRELEKYTSTDYEIVVVTGNKKLAGTDANVSIELFGPRNKSTPVIELKKKDKDLFEKGSTDIFKIENMTYVGPIQKVRIKHDNHGRSPGWFLERVVVTDLKDHKVKYFCPCNKWLARDEDDGQISRDLLATTDLFNIQKIGKYKITVFTGNKRNAGTDADVSIILYGSVGDSGEWRLDDEKNNFERGTKDEFEIECPSIGLLEKIKIGHNNKGVAAGWYLNKVIVDDMEKHKVYEFVADRWLAKDEDDGKTNIYLHPNSGSSKVADKGIPYTVNVFTGDIRNASTSAKVFIELFGGRNEDQSTGKIMLQDGEFERGRIDKLFIESPILLSPLSKILIGHDNSGAGPGWFLDQIEIECPSSGLTQSFPCGEWLAKDESDGRIERVLKENLSLRRESKPKSVWTVWVYTADMKMAGTDANVYVVMYGDQGKTEEVYLRDKKDNFEAGQCDTFKVETARIGTPFKMRVGHDNKGTAPGWFLDHIEVENMQTNERFKFNCNRWLSKDEEDHEIVREIPAEGRSIRNVLPLANYTVEVTTGKKMGAGTDANVFVNIFGEYGDTGDRYLERSSTNRNKFERDQVDVFKIEAVTLKKLHKIRIGHDGNSPGAGWFLKEVTIKQEGNSKYDQTFECNRWLATDEDDGLIVRELMADGSQFLDLTSYHVKVKTGDVRNAGTDADVTLRIFGSKGDSGKKVLRSNDNNKMNKFERNQVDEFKIENEDIGKIDRIQIGHNGKGLGSGWFLDYVEIDLPAKGLRYIFSCHRWLDENEEDGLTKLELFPTEVKKVRKTIPYVFTTKTADKRGAGTDSNIFIQMYGTNGKSEEYPLKTRSDGFERGKEDVFKIEADDVGEIYKVRIGHDDSGSNSGWMLESLKIERHGQKSNANIRHDDLKIEEYFFLVNKWFARDEDDGQIIREIVPTDERGRPLVVLDEIPYEVKVFTGDKSGAGTDANVFMTIYGNNGDSGERELRKSDNLNKFERNVIDTFKVKAVELGDLEKIKIGHDNSAAGSAWYLEKVEIYNPSTKRTYLFNCQNWLAKNEGDGKITRELVAIDPDMLKRVKFRAGAKELKDQILLETEALTTTYNITVVTSDKRGAGTDANVFIQLFGNQNDSGKHDLKFSKTNRNKFERGQKDVFEVKCSDVGSLRKIRIGHDGSSFGDGWHLQEVEIDAPKLGRRWKFLCNRWFDKSEDDGRIERELYPSQMSNEDYMPFVAYEIVVFTSDMRGADTSANPYIVLYGDEMKTEKVNLCKNRAERKDKFKRGNIDRFALELDDVGDHIRKIRIGHDNDGITSGWHLDKVEIRRLKKSGKGSKIHVFPCNRWLARDEEDRAIERDLIVSKIIDEKVRNGEVQSREEKVHDQLEMKDYVVEVFTGDVSRAGTNANVFLTVFGEFGDTGEKKLIKSETHTDKFERKQMDRFVVQAADLGRIFKCIIRHDDSGLSSDWFLDKMKIKDGRDIYTFLCERWLSKSKEDKKIERTLFEKNYKGPQITSSNSLSLSSKIGGSQFRNKNDHPVDGPTIPYSITIRTGDERHCGNSAQVFIRLLGSHRKADTGRIDLQLAKRRRFEPGSAEIFQIDALDIGDLKQVELGHDGIGRDCNWFVKDIEIKSSLTGIIYNITCNSWLSTEYKDGLTVRKFYVDEATTKIISSEGLVPFNLSVQTGDIPKAGTDSNVTLKFFGSRGTSSDIKIEKIDNRFERASVDNLSIELEDIGSLKKVRVTIDARGARKEWFLNCIELTNMISKKQYLFVCEEWLSRNHDKLTIDVPLFKAGQETIPKTDYKITVKTSDLMGAGTDANVFLIIFGQNGDSGELELKKSETNMNKFERNRTDIFLFKNILSLGELVKCRVWHDNTGSLIGNTNWHLSNIKIEDQGNRKVFNFKCNKWLSLSKDDKQIVRELKPDTIDEPGVLTPRIGEKASYEITVMTSDERNAGTKQNGFIVLIGENNQESRPKFFENTYENKVLRRGQTDVFKFTTKSVGALKKILVGHQSKQDDPPRTREERNAPWICSQVIVKDLASDVSYIFPVMDTLILDKEPKMYRLESVKESSASSYINKTKKLSNVSYEVVVVTGSEKSAGTSATGSITIYGDNGDSGKRILKKAFVRDDKDKFNIECIDLGIIKKITLEHDNSGFSKHWFVDRVEIRNQETNQTYIFPCNKWLSKVKEDGSIARDLFPLADERAMSRSSLKSPRSLSRDMDRDRDFSRDSARDRNKPRMNFDQDFSRGFDRGSARGMDKKMPFEREISSRKSPRDFDRDILREKSFERDMPRSKTFGPDMSKDKGFGRDMSMERGLGRDVPMERGFGRDMPIERGLGRDVPMERGFGRDMPIERGLGRDIPMERGFGRDMPIERGLGRDMPMERDKSFERDFGYDMDKAPVRNSARGSARNSRY